MAVKAALWATVAPVAVTEVSGATPPTIPVIATMPEVPPVNTKGCALLMVPENVIFAPAAEPPLFVVSTVMGAPRAAGPLIETAPPLVVRLPPRLTAVEPV